MVTFKESSMALCKGSIKVPSDTLVVTVQFSDLLQITFFANKETLSYL